jgi:tetratricopeptide (TPR) repeat protein
MLRNSASLLLVGLAVTASLRAASVQDAYSAYEAGDYAAAAAIAEQILHQFPTNGDAVQIQAMALNAQGVALAEASEWQAAISKLRDAARLAPDSQVIQENWQRALINGACALAQDERKYSEANALLRQLPAELEGDVALRRQQAGSFIELLWARDAQGQGNERVQRNHLEAALQWQPDNVAALVDLADWHYRQDEFDEALQLYRRALELEPGLPHVATEIQQIERERQITAGFVTERTPHFTLSYPAGAREFARTCQQVLEPAYTRIGQDFRHWPSRRIPVVIYSHDQFRGVTLAPDWAQAAYDGKIRVFVRPIRTNDERRALQDTLSHELTHAFIFDLAGKNCPAWLNEGLAQNYEINFDITPRMAAMLEQWRASGLLTPIVDYPDDFSGIGSTEEAQRAYLESASFTAYLIRRFGAHRLREVLQDLGQGEALAPAIENRLRVPLAELDRHWRESL